MNEIVLAIGIATCGRRELLQKVIEDISHQTELPERIYISPIDKEGDVGIMNLPKSLQTRVEIVQGLPGLTTQRNTIIRLLHEDVGIILFLDDDFVMHKDYCKELKMLFVNNSDVVGSAGLVLADGINTKGIVFEDAKKILESYTESKPRYIRDNGTTYGCNMAFRVSTLLSHKLSFDEKLPLYGWFEDLDFSAQVAQFGSVVNMNCCVGVHLGSKSGRTKGNKLGYSQVVNPAYLYAKGTMSGKDAIRNILRRVFANLMRCFWPEPWVDRWGRVKGNWLGIFELLLGRADPRRILKM